MRPEEVSSALLSIQALGSRAPGQPGHDATYEMLKHNYQQAGLEIYEQPVGTIHAVTEKCALTLDGFESGPRIWPAAPNHSQPIVTPDEGISGELMLATEESILAAGRFDDKIAVVDLARPVSRELGLKPTRYDELGFKALILTHSDGLEHIQWSELAGLRINLPYNYTRLVSDPSILERIGEGARLDVKVRYESIMVTNLVAIMRAPGEPSNQALFIDTSYDSYTLLPDLAYGTINALQLAFQQQLLKGLLEHRQNIVRDVVFINTAADYMAQNSLNRLLALVGQYDAREAVQERLAGERRENEGKLVSIKAILRAFEDLDFGVEARQTALQMRKLSTVARRFCDEQFRYLMRKRVFAASEPLLQAQILFNRNPEDESGPEFAAYRAAKEHSDDLNSFATLSLSRYLMQTTEDFDTRTALADRMEKLRLYHVGELERIEKEEALAGIFAGYSELLSISPTLSIASAVSGHEEIGFTSGKEVSHGEAAEVFQRAVLDAISVLDLHDRVSINYHGRNHGTLIHPLLSDMPIHAIRWAQLSYPSFSVLNIDGNYSSYYNPLPDSGFTNLYSIANTMQVLGEVVVSLSRGYGRFPRLQRCTPYSLKGSVFIAGVGNSVVPNFPAEEALVFNKDFELTYTTQNGAGYQRHPYMLTNSYGDYYEPMLSVGVFTSQADPTPLSVVKFDDRGIIAYAKDEGDNAQNMYKSQAMEYKGAPVNLVLYRANPVAVLNLNNPQSMRDFVSADFIQVNGLIPFDSVSTFKNEDGIVEFIPPEKHFYVALKAGAADNDLVAVTRAFCLGIFNNDFTPNPDNEIDGPGYLAQDISVLRNVAAEAAASMEFMADKRLRLQSRYGMVDDMTASFHQRAKSALERGNSEDKPYLARLRDYRQAVSYQVLNHPVIRNSINEAVWGILWYLALLVPFIFFFEKLVFGFTDIRKQLTAQAAIFLLVFALLRLLHPAFQMIRSSLMILLGFVIILISGGITLVLSGKFRENIQALRHSQGAVKGADVSKSGVMLTAFMLGLNNMHKRKVRTGLTCATLVLMTFVMISFTSVQSNVVDRSSAIGEAPYQGLLVKKERFDALTLSEITALESRFGEKFAVNPRETIVGNYNYILARGITPEFNMAYRSRHGVATATARAALGLSHRDPLKNSIRLLGANGWFTAEQETRSGDRKPVIIPDTMAEALGIDIKDVDAGKVVISINAADYLVYNIFDSQAFGDLGDLDGQSMLAFDAEAIVNPQIRKGAILAESDDPRVPASHTLLSLPKVIKTPEDSAAIVASVGIDMGQSNFRTAREEIVSYLEQTGRESYYGLDGIAYLGRRARERSMKGLVDLLIPLVIAALTVLNTMKGSVYERRDEIFVYNAVGIAPRYVFFMFVAEALVYAVVGSLLGYILSQGTGRILTTLGWTGGLNMNFTSITTVYASLAIGAATLLSTWFPARSAMEIAKPAEKSGWSLPETETDEMSIDLPFTFTHYDRIAVLGFFHRYFVDMGEGSAGPFFADEPRLAVFEKSEPGAESELVPAIITQVWLKPFDLGVSQTIEIDLATDPDTGEYISRMRLKRVSGTREAWLRLNEPMVARIRLHFLLWRAVTDNHKETLYEEAKQLLVSGMEEQSVNG